MTQWTTTHRWPLALPCFHLNVCGHPYDLSGTASFKTALVKYDRMHHSKVHCAIIILRATIFSRLALFASVTYQSDEKSHHPLLIHNLKIQFLLCWQSQNWLLGYELVSPKERIGIIKSKAIQLPSWVLNPLDCQNLVTFPDHIQRYHRDLNCILLVLLSKPE